MRHSLQIFTNIYKYFTNILRVWYKYFSHPSITDSKEPQNALLLIVVQEQSLPRDYILLHSTEVIKIVKRTPLLVQASWVGLCYDSLDLLGLESNLQKLHRWSTGWRRLIGSPKLQIIFHKRATKFRSLLRKMTYKDKGSYESSPPCTNAHYSSDNDF